MSHWNGTHTHGAFQLSAAIVSSKAISGRTPPQESVKLPGITLQLAAKTIALPPDSMFKAII